EQAAGRAHQVGPASDIYSLGATLYCLLTGTPPFADAPGAGVQGVLDQVQQGQFRRPRQVHRQISPALETICLRAMALRPKDRYASAEALADDLEHWLAHEPVAASSEPWPGRRRRWAWWHRRLVTGLAASLVVGLMGLTVALVLATGFNRQLNVANAGLLLANTHEQQARERSENVLKYFVATFRRAD